MKVEQVYSIVNDLSAQYIGEDAITVENNDTLVDVGSKVINLDNLDKYVNSLIDQIGKVMFVNRVYSTKVPSLHMEGWEYGAIMEKIEYDGLPEAETNQSWNLTDGESYDPNVFTQPKVTARFFSKKNTYDIPMSFAERQVKTAFQSASQLNSFFSMIENAIRKSMTVKMDELALNALNIRMCASMKYYSGAATPQWIKLATLAAAAGVINEVPATFAEKEKLLYSPEFIRFASMTMKRIAERMQRLSVQFNTGHVIRFTPTEQLKLILHSDFVSAAGAYLQSDTFHDEFVALPQADTVPFWVAPGQSYAFEDTSTILTNNPYLIDTSDDYKVKQANPAVSATYKGVIGVMFDSYAVAVCNMDRRVTSNYNGRAEFYNNWYKFDAGYFTDLNENMVIFTLD